MHKEARINHTLWAKGKFALCAQTVQQVNQAFLANVDITREVRKQNCKIRYSWQDKQFYPILFSRQAVTIKPGRVMLLMGRGRQSIVLKLDLPDKAGGCKLVWSDGYELHVSVGSEVALDAPGEQRAIVDLGEIYTAAVTTNTGVGLIVKGRGIHSLKRQRHKTLGQIAKKRSRCQKYSRRWKRLQRARREIFSRTYKPKGRNWQCRKCSFTGHRDLVGSVNMHPIGFGEKIRFPKQITYLRPGKVRSSSSADTRQRCLRELVGQAPASQSSRLGAVHSAKIS